MNKPSLVKKINSMADSEKNVVYNIDPILCRGCDFCKKNCPANAISGEIKKPHKINLEKCLRCGACLSACPFKAISQIKK